MINILEIIKKAPRDHKYFCTIAGYHEIEIDPNNEEYPLYFNNAYGHFSFTKEGYYYNNNYFGECVLFPSRDLRDWKKFELLLDSNKKEPKYSFKPFDKVLVRDSPTSKWRCNIYSHYNSNDEDFPYLCIYNAFKYCIPYEGNEDKVGKV